MGSEFENLIKSLQDSNQRDDLKLKAVQEIWLGLDVFCSSSTYSALMDSLIKVIIRLLNETQPQFISENNTHQLRNQILEILLRTSTHEAMKGQVKEIAKTLLRLITVDNEENAILAIKILMDVGKTSKMHFMPEVQTVSTFCRDIVKGMSTHVYSGMFELHDLGLPSRWSTRLTQGRQHYAHQPEEGFINSVLPMCFCVQPVTITNKITGGEPAKYNLIPRSHQSVKIIQELTMFFVHLYQHYKNNILNECLDFLLLCIHFASLVIPNEAKENQFYNKALADEFYTSQTKCLTFVNIIGKIPQFMEVIQQHSNILISGMLCLLENLPSDLVVLRKDILMTLKFCFSTDLRNKFVPLLPRLLSEEALLGKGFTSVDHLRVFMYQMLADLLHHMKNSLSFPMIAHTVAVFGRTLNDNSITPHVQIMCVRLLSSMCDTMNKHEQQGEATRDILMNILENFAVKLKRISVYHLPILFRLHGAEVENRPLDRRERGSTNDDDKTKGDLLDGTSRRCSLDTVVELEACQQDLEGAQSSKQSLLPAPTKSGKQTSPDEILANLWTINTPSMSVLEARNLVKYVMHACKFCAAQMGNTRRSNVSIPKSKERDLFERLLKYGIQCMDVFVLPYQPAQNKGEKTTPSSSTGRSKEEKEALDSFAALFTSIDADVYRELFAKYIDFLVERIHYNMSLQLIVNAFLVRPDWSCKFGSIMLKYLMDKIPCLAVSNEKTVLYLKLFKSIFSAIGCQTQSSPDGELMLKPYLPDLIRKSTDFALSAREPLNYFLLLRALFRSIGGGAHDILYGQFLPLLPNLLQFLNKLQSCQHRQQMRELFLELCLTVPVRLSSLLPYLPLLMDPLVCALNGSSALVQQGLRTLELCVDNLQPEYLFEHMAPVRGALIRGLWRVLGSPADTSSAAVAFRILGKFGGANRKILNEPQQLESIEESEVVKCGLQVKFDRAGENEEKIIGELALTDIMHEIVQQMRLCTPQPEPSAASSGSLVPLQFVNQTTQPNRVLLRQSCVELARAVLLTSLGPPMTGEEWKEGFVEKLREQFRKLDSLPADLPVFKCPREADRQVCIDALVVLFIGVIGKDLRNQYLKFFNAMVRQLTIHGLLECAAHSLVSSSSHLGLALCVDGSVLVDALVVVLSDPNKDFLYSAVVALCHINETCKTVLPRGELMSRVPFISYLLQRVNSLCYGPSWFSRLGGASALNYVIENYPAELIKHNLDSIVESLCEVIVGLVDEISSGAVDMAVDSLKALGGRVVTDPSRKDDFIATFLRHYVLLIFHGEPSVREKTWSLISLLSVDADIPIDKLLEGQTTVLKEKTASIMREMGCQSLCDQSASLSILYSLVDAAPQSLSLDERREDTRRHMEALFDLCETSASQLLTRAEYKLNLSCPGHFLPPYPIIHQMDVLRANGIRALVAVYRVLRLNSEGGAGDVLSPLAARTIRIALNALQNDTQLVMDAAKQALKGCVPIPLNVLESFGEELLKRLMTGNELQAEDVCKLSQLVQLNPALFSPQLAESIVKQVSTWRGTGSVVGEQPQSRTVEDIEAVHTLLRMILDSEVSTPSMVSSLYAFAAYFESEYCIDSPLTWLPVLCELLSRTPSESLAFLLSETNLSSYPYATFLRRTIKHPKSVPLRSLLCSDGVYFDKMLQHQYMDSSGAWCAFSDHSADSVMEREETILQLLDTVAREQLDWFGRQHELVERLRTIWNSADFKLRYNVRQMYVEEGDKHQIKVQTVAGPKYKVPGLLVNCFIRYLRLNRDSFDLLFDVLFVFDNNYATDFCFVKDFLEKEVIPCYPLAWRHSMFELVLAKFEKEPEVWQKNTTMARMVQYLIIPCLHWAFERYNVDEILGAPPSPGEQDEDPTSVVTRLAGVVDRNRSSMGDKNVIVFYQLCTLLVEHAPLHIHDNTCKKQGGRLRVFMQFAWPCLTPNTHWDPTLKFTGYLFLAHIIDRFTINRKIVLQVFQCLASTYHMDNRDQLKRAIDVLTPAVPVRMEDGHQQMLSVIKKILLEESHNIPQIYHVAQMVVRNYRVYFYVRHELIPPLLQAIQRAMHTPNGLIEGLSARRLALEVCETAIKWDLLRNQMVEQKQTREEAETQTGIEVENVLEALKSSEKEDKADSGRSSATGSPTDGTGTSAATPTTAAPQTSISQMSKIEATISAQTIMKERGEQVMKPIAKEYVDQIVTILLKFACQLPSASQPQQYSSTTSEMSKRGLGLLRAALKPVVWGDTVTIRSQWMEKQVTISAEVVSQRHEPSSQATQQLAQAQHTLEVILALTSVMPKSLILQVIRPIQRAIISCLNSSTSSLVRSVNYLIGRLFEKTKSSNTGIDELDILNQYMSKFLNDQFNNYYKSPNAVLQQVFTAFALLRAICAHQPGYLDAMCLQAFIKVLEKAVREHLSHVAAGTDSNREKTVAELISMALELIRPRVQAMGHESRRVVCQSVLLPLIERTNYEKVIENLLKITHELVTTHKSESTPNPGLPLAVRLHALMDKRVRSSSLHQNGPLMSLYLNLVHVIFDHPLYKTSEYAHRINSAFYWGLVSPDPDIRDRFLSLWERDMDPFIVSRVLHVIMKQDWTNFGDYYWLRHALWICIKCLRGQGTEKDLPREKCAVFGDCASLWRTIENINGMGDIIPSMGAINMGQEDHPRREEQADTPMEDSGSGADPDRLSTLLLEQRELLAEAGRFRLETALDAVKEVIFNSKDTKFVSVMWKSLFNSLWDSYTEQERIFISNGIVPFMISAVHNPQIGSIDSVLSTWLDTLSSTSTPFKLPPRVVQFVAIRHRAWYEGVLQLEDRVMQSGCRMLNNPLLMQAQVDRQTREQLDCMDYLADLYRDLWELDQFQAVWDRRATKPETLAIMEKMQMGDLVEASDLVEKVVCMTDGMMSLPVFQAPIMPAMMDELQQVYDAYTGCCTELMEWEKLRDFSNSQEVQSPRNLMLAGVHLPDWNIVRQCRDQLCGCVPPDFYNSYTIYNAMLSVMQPSENNRQTDPLALSSKSRMEKLLDEATQAHLTRWRRLPSIVGNAHVKLLQAMNLIREVSDGMDLHNAIESGGSGGGANFTNDMKNIIKVWRSRSPAVSDELSFVASMYNWRCQVHAMVIKRFEELDNTGVSLPAGTNSQSILPIHSAAQGHLVVAKMARNMRLYDLATEQLNKLHTLITVPLMDAHQKMCEQAKLLRAQAIEHTTTPQQKNALLSLALKLFDDTTISDFSRDQVCKFFTIKGSLLSLLNQREAALKAFSVAGQTYDGPSFQPANSSNVFKAWGNHMDRIFHSDKSDMAGITSGCGAIACFLEAARSESEPKARKYIARFLWTAKHMVACGPTSCNRLDEQIQKHERTTVAFNWLSWLPQLVGDVKMRPQSKMILIIHRIASAYPLQTFYCLRGVLPIQLIDAVVEEVCLGGAPFVPASDEKDWIVAVLPVLRAACKARASDIRMFHRLLFEMANMREFWAERQLRFAHQMKEEVFRCLDEQRRLGVSCIGLDDAAGRMLAGWWQDVEDSCGWRVMGEDEVEYAMDGQRPTSSEQEFISELTPQLLSVLSAPPPAGQILRFMEVLLKIVQRLQKRVDRLPRRFSLKTTSPFLSVFSHRNACIEMPTDMMNVLKSGQYVSIISRLDPHVEISTQGGELMRKISIRATTGKVCTYYLRRVLRGGSLDDADRCQQYIASLNGLLNKERETCRRHLSVYTPTRLKVGEGASLMETAGVVANFADAPPATLATIIHPMEILSRALLPLGMRPDDVVAMFYDRLLSDGGPERFETRASVYSQLTIEEFVSSSILSRYLHLHFPQATHFYALRKQLVRHVSVLNVVEWVTRLSPMGLADMYLNRLTGQFTNPNYTFDLRVADRPVPFRMTPNIANLIGFAMNGDLRWCSVAVSRCLFNRHPEIMLRPLLWDHVAQEGSDASMKELWSQADSFINEYTTCIANLVSPDASHPMQNICGLLTAAQQADNICRINAALHPWF